MKKWLLGIFTLVVQSVFVSACSHEAAPIPDYGRPGPDGGTDGVLSEKMRVVVKGENLYIGARLDSSYDILYWFKKCMFNNLYTFYRVGLKSNTGKEPLNDPAVEPSEVLNLASSDNIGPFLTKEAGWCGGNHAYTDNKTATAYNVGFRIIVDGKECSGNVNTLADSIRVTAENCILNPVAIGNGNQTDKVLTEETAEYVIKGNSITVKLKHKFMNTDPVTIETYYGMQSMFSGETYTMTVGGAYKDWTPENNISNFKKLQYPDMCCFIEKSGTASQASYLLDTGLGSHGSITDDDIIFIGNSYGKSYHKMISKKEYEIGDIIEWKGVYSWFRKAATDNSQLISFTGYVGNSKAVFIFTKDRTETDLTLDDGVEYRILETRGDISAEFNSSEENGTRQIHIKSEGSAGCVLIAE